MRSRCPGAVRRLRTIVLSSLVLLTVTGADECPDREPRTALETLIASLPDAAWGAIEPLEHASLRIHRYPDGMQKGDVVEAFSPGGGADPSNRRTCQSDGGCLLFFVDTDHWAHFAHTTVVAVWEKESESFQPPLVGEWWPLLNEKPIFDKVAKRENWFDPLDPDTRIIVFPPDLPTGPRPQPMAGDPTGISVSQPSSMRLVTLGVEPESTGEQACPVWAVIVDGYDDPDDTFEIDTGGMYQALRGLGVPGNQIFFMCPDPANTEGCEIDVYWKTLKKILTQTLGAEVMGDTQNLVDSPCQEMVLFYSAHGGAGKLWCGECSDCFQVDYSDLDTWLDLVHCAAVTVVIEACQSGASINTIKAGPTGQTRYVFTSTDQNGVSYRDLDTSDYGVDKNPGDIGSETVWGYVEGLGTGETDTDANAKISFVEATDYAITYDLSKLGGNDPLVHIPVAETPASAVHSCASTAAGAGLKIELSQEPLISPGQPGDLLRCRCNRFKATVSSPTNVPPPVATARFFWTTAPDPHWEVGDQPDFKEIWNSTRLIPAQGYPYTFEIEWETGKNLEAGSTITLLAIADSPQSKIPKGNMVLADLLNQTAQASALKLEVINPSKCWLFPCKGGDSSCD